MTVGNKWKQIMHGKDPTPDSIYERLDNLRDTMVGGDQTILGLSPPKSIQPNLFPSLSHKEVRPLAARFLGGTTWRPSSQDKEDVRVSTIWVIVLGLPHYKYLGTRRQFVEVLRYNSGGRGFDSRWGESLEFFIDIILLAALWPWGWLSH
jgi:hypothetical protein